MDIKRIFSVWILSPLICSCALISVAPVTHKIKEKMAAEMIESQAVKLEVVVTVQGEDLLIQDITKSKVGKRIASDVIQNGQQLENHGVRRVNVQIQRAKNFNSTCKKYNLGLLCTFIVPDISEGEVVVTWIDETDSMHGKEIASKKEKWKMYAHFLLIPYGVVKAVVQGIDTELGLLENLYSRDRDNLAAELSMSIAEEVFDK